MVKILLIDDDELLSTLWATTLSSQGYEVDIAANQANAATLVNEQEYDLVVIDWLLPRQPDREGLNNAYQIKCQNPSTPIVMLSNTILDNTRARQHGIDYLLTSPCEPKQLLSLVKLILAWKVTSYQRAA